MLCMLVKANSGITNEDKGSVLLFEYEVRVRVYIFGNISKVGVLFKINTVKFYFLRFTVVNGAFFPPNYQIVRSIQDYPQRMRLQRRL